MTVFELIILVIVCWVAGSYCDRLTGPDKDDPEEI